MTRSTTKSDRPGSAGEAHIKQVYALFETLVAPPPAAKKGRIGYRVAQE